MAAKKGSGSSARKSGSSGSNAGIAAVLERFGLDASVVDDWRAAAKQTINDKVKDGVEDFDISEAVDRAREYAAMSSEKLKEISRKNPKAFYSGIAAVLVGAGLISAAAAKSGGKRSSGSTSSSSKSSSSSSSKSGGSKKSSRKSGGSKKRSSGKKRSSR